MEFSQKLQQLRKQKGITQEQFIEMYRDTHKIHTLDIRTEVDLIDRYMLAEMACKHIGFSVNRLGYDAENDKLYLKLE